MITQIDTTTTVMPYTVAGIPCQVQADLWGDLNLFDRKGYRANWLHKKMTVRDWIVLENDWLAYCQAQMLEVA